MAFAPHTIPLTPAPHRTCARTRAGPQVLDRLVVAVDPGTPYQRPHVTLHGGTRTQLLAEWGLTCADPVALLRLAEVLTQAATALALTPWPYADPDPDEDQGRPHNGTYA